MSQQQPFLLENDERFSNLSPIHDEIERGAGEDDFVSFSVIDSSEQGHWFEVVKHDAREIYQIVKALAFREYCTLIVNNEGIRVVIDDQHNQQASAYFKYEQFSDYNIRVNVCNLRVPIAVFMEALNMFTGNTSVLRMWYDGEGSPLMVCQEDEGIVVQAAIRTLNLQSMLDFEFTNTYVMCKAILSPTPIKEILRDLDNSAETVMLIFTQNYIAFYTVGELGKIKIELPANAPHTEHLTCKEERVCFQYRSIQIKRLAESVRLSNKVSLRIDQRGVLCVQLLIPQSDQMVFVEFYCIADDDIYHPDTS